VVRYTDLLKYINSSCLFCSGCCKKYMLRLVLRNEA